MADNYVHVRFPGTFTARGRHGVRRTYPNTFNYRVATAEQAREIASGATKDEGKATFVRVTLADGRVFCWTPERGWWQKKS